MSRGFTLVEMVIVAAIVPIVLGAVFMIARNFSDIRSEAAEAVIVTEKLRTSLRKISDELRTSSKTAEAEEDLNGNGRLDADWALTPTSITFNRMLPDGTYSLPITYRLVNGNLERRWMSTATGPTHTTVIARSVASFSVTEASPQLTIAMVVSVTKPGGKVETESSSITVVQRN
jgi:prepilin-type N-terminal cleavage/methylation domain-containing protein